MSSSSVLPQSPHILSVLSSLLNGEKEHTRSWLRTEMDRLIDPMLHSIFSRLTNKLANFDLNQSGVGGNRAQVNSSQNHVKSPNHPTHQPSSRISQPSTSFTPSFNPHSYKPHSIGYEPEFDPEIWAQVKREIKEEQNEMKLQNLMDNLTHANQFPASLSTNNHHLFHKTYSVHEDDQFGNQTICDDHQSNGQVTDTQQDGDKPEIEEDGDGQAEVAEENEGGEDDVHKESVVNTRIETSRPYLIEQTQVFVRQSTSISKQKQTEEEQAKEVNNRVNQEGVEEENVDEQEVTSGSIKRPRASTTSSSTKQALFITVTLQCPQCGLMFAKDKLNAHLKEHSIRAFRCLVKNCAQSFESTYNLSQHLAQSHQSIAQWHCAKCELHFHSYARLSIHNTQCHHIGHFQCSFPTCTFTGEHKRKMYHHYAHRHSKAQLEKCKHFGCRFETQDAYKMKRHQRVHLGIKPYKCNWPQCGYASIQKNATIRHIRVMHLNRSSVPNRDPSDFLDVVRELL